MSKRISAMLVGVAALAMLGAGCGGGDEETVTKAEFVKEGKAVCAEVVKEIGAEMKAFTKENNLEGTATKKQATELMEDVFIPQLQAEVDQLSELTPPEADEEKITAMLDQLNAGIEEGGKDPASFLTTTESKFFKAGEALRDYGLEGCATVI